MRSPSVALTAYDEFSSPDPLASTSTEVNNIASSPSKRRSSAVTNRSQPKSPSSHRNKTTNYSIHSIPVSPSRTVTEQTLSPWKIRVTVEAEPEESYNGALQTITRTMKVPLKEEESSPLSQNKQTTRSRQSADGNASAKNRRRSVTPSGRRRRQSVTDLDIVVLGDDDDGDEWIEKKKKTSPKKRASRKSTDASEKNFVNTNFDIQRDNGMEGDEGHHVVHSDSPELREIDLNRVSVRQRAGSMKQKNLPEMHFEEPLPTTEHDGPVASTKPKGNRKVSTNSTRSYPTPSPTPSGQIYLESVDTEKAIEPEYMEGLDTIMESEGFTMIDLDTIPSVRQLRSSPSDEDHSGVGPTRENTVQRSFSSQEESRNVQKAAPAKPFPSYLAMAEDESDISSSLPSSPPISRSIPEKLRAKHSQPSLQVPFSGSKSRLRQVTPMSYSSPRLPSPPRPAPTKERSTPDSAKILKAGLILQGALDPKTFPIPTHNVMPVQQVSVEQVQSNVSSGSAELFEGFDSNTQRELRAGLRFGEELAKRQQSKKPPLTKHEERKLTDTASPVWRGEHGVQGTPVLHTSQDHTLDVHSKALSDSVSYPKLTAATATSDKAMTLPSQREIDQETLWQRERDAVVEQIEQATPGKVIIIDSDSEDENEDMTQVAQDESNELFDEDDDDIWLAEAKDASSSPHGQQESPLVSEMTNQPPKDRNTLVIEKPRRSLIPSPWKRGEQVQNVENESTVLTVGDGESAMSGLFWKQPTDEDEDLRFGAGELKVARKELRKSGSTGFGNRTGSGCFDLSKMMGTPKRTRESLEKNNQQQIQQPSPQSSPVSQQHDDTSNEQSISEDDEERDYSTLEPPQTIPVNFNDSTASEIATPTQQIVTPPSPSIQRPPTPRSAMKGARQSFDTNQQDHSNETSDQIRRRVVWAKRSSCVDEDWVESSRSIRSDHLTPVNSHIGVEEHEAEEELTEISSQPSEQPEAPVAQKGWLNWLTTSKAEKQYESSVSSSQQDIVPQHDGSDDSFVENTEQEWQATARTTQPITSSPISSTTTHKTTPNPSTSKKQPTTIIPSYLLPPSYPTDPTLTTTSPLQTTSGEFTTPHIRTLHIIYRKSQRPRFHAPKFRDCRPEIRELVNQKCSIHIDEESAGLGGFSFRIGEVEARVLERWCREVEFGYLCCRRRKMTMMSRGSDGDGGGNDSQGEISDIELVEQLMNKKTGIWSGNIGHGCRGFGDIHVEWGWSCDMLATLLGRIVVGEVVRAEEFGGGNHGKK